MGNHENFETVKTAEATHENNIGTIDLYADRRGSHSVHDHHESTDSLVSKGVLPPIDLIEMSSEYRTGKVAASRDLSDAGVKTKLSAEKDGAQTTSTDYGNGVIISSTEGGKPTDLGNGHKLTFKNNMAVEVHYPNHAKLNGDVVDPKGKLIAKHNEDGSYTVDTGKGFFTQYADGTIRKETAIRSRDSKSFTVIDTETPLGDLRPSDMTHHK